MWTKQWVNSILLVLSLAAVECHKILVYNPRYSHSHANFMGRIADILVDAGHEVVTFIPEVVSGEKTNGTKRSRIILGPHFTSSIVIGNVAEAAITDFDRLFRGFMKVIKDACEVQLSDHATLRRLEKERFDFGIVEVFSYCGFAIFHRIGLKNYAAAFATDLVEVMSDPLGVSSNPSFVPGTFGRQSIAMNYWGRVTNFVEYMKTYSLTTFMFRSANQLQLDGYDHFEAIRKSSLVFVNAIDVLEFPRLLSHKVVSVGGIALDKPKPLNCEYQRIMNASKNGAVLVSFGTVAAGSRMANTIKYTFYETFRSFPEVTFIWKYEADDDFASDLPNVFKKKWIPQNDLLGHPNMQGFVSHCGQNSLMETVSEGVPVVCIPLFGDQLHNSRVAEGRKIGVYIERLDLSVKTLTKAIEKILYDARYRARSKRMQRMIHENPLSPRERLLQFVDYAVKFGPMDNFDVASNDLSLFQYYLLDIIIPLIILSSLAVYLIFRLLCYVVHKLLLMNKLKTE